MCKQWTQSKHAESLEGQTREAGMPHLNASFLPLNIIDNEKHYNPFVVLFGWLVDFCLFVCCPVFLMQISTRISM